MAEQVTEVRDNSGQSRYEITIDGEVVGFCSYRQADGVVLLPHAEVDPRVGGRGVGSQLARGTLDDLRRHGHKVVPLCPFVANFIAKNPEYADLVDE
jgi:predicted GNAT family acetyltransferase